MNLASPPLTFPGRRLVIRRPGNDLLAFLGRRIAAALVLLLGITFVAFVLTELVPGDPAAANLGQRAIDDPAAVAAFRAHYDLNKPLPQQYLLYLSRLLRGDLGQSQQSHRGVATDLAQYVPATLELAALAIVLSLVIGVAAGVLSAIARDRLPDQIIRVVSLTGVSVPTFWLALVAFYLFFYKLGIAPGSGRLGPNTTPPPDVTGLYTVDAVLAGQWGTLTDALSHLILPAAVLAVYTVGILTRFTRAAVLEVLGNDYVRAARAKGLPERTVVLRHVLRPALASVITVAGIAFGSLLSGTVLVESVFSWPGLGQYAYQSAINLDLPAILGVSLVVAVVFIATNLLVDVLYAVIDPRIRLA